MSDGRPSLMDWSSCLYRLLVWRLVGVETAGLEGIVYSQARPGIYGGIHLLGMRQCQASQLLRRCDLDMRPPNIMP